MKADIVERLRAWVHTVKAVPASDIMDEAADEIDRLRNGSLAACETVRLTDAEREAIREACDEGRWYPKDYHHIHTLRGLLDRLC
jgi:hypothetical protein